MNPSNMIRNLIYCTGHRSTGWNAEQMEKYGRLIVGWSIDGTAADLAFCCTCS